MSLKRNPLICIMLLAVLISIPLVDADEYPSASSAVTAAETQLPQLHFNNSQEKVIVTGELSPEQTTEFTQVTAIAQTPASLTIPLGSIIYHADNVTTVFDATGQQLLAADDAQAATFHTFRGDLPASFIHEVPDKSVIVDNGDTLYVVYNNTRILTIIDNSKQSQIPRVKLSQLK